MSTAKSDLTPEILEARKKMEERFGNLKLGGKGSQKKKKIVVHKSSAVQDKKIAAVAKKAGAKNIGEINEINVFRDDNTVFHFKKPKLEYSLKEKVSFVTGQGESKNLQELLPNILKQLGPKQFKFVQDYAKTLEKPSDKKKEETPDLVEDFEAVSKQD